MAVSKEVFGEWKTHAVTVELKKELTETLEQLVGQMISRMEPDPARDSFTRAFAKAIDVIFSWQPEFLPEDKND